MSSKKEMLSPFDHVLMVLGLTPEEQQDCEAGFRTLTQLRAIPSDALMDDLMQKGVSIGSTEGLIKFKIWLNNWYSCLLYTSDAADE